MAGDSAGVLVTALLLAGALGLTGSAGELFVAAARGRAPAAAALAAVNGGRLQRGGAASPLPAG